MKAIDRNANDIGIGQVAATGEQRLDGLRLKSAAVRPVGPAPATMTSYSSCIA
jgi:hypothetical protein